MASVSLGLRRKETMNFADPSGSSPPRPLWTPPSIPTGPCGPSRASPPRTAGCWARWATASASAPPSTGTCPEIMIWGCSVRLVPAGEPAGEEDDLRVTDGVLQLQRGLGQGVGGQVADDHRLGGHARPEAGPDAVVLAVSAGKHGDHVAELTEDVDLPWAQRVGETTAEPVVALPGDSVPIDELLALNEGVRRPRRPWCFPGPPRRTHRPDGPLP